MVINQKYQDKILFFIEGSLYRIILTQSLGPWVHHFFVLFAFFSCLLANHPYVSDPMETCIKKLLDKMVRYWPTQELKSVNSKLLGVAT